MPTACTLLEDKLLTPKQGSQKLHTEVTLPHFPPPPTTLGLQLCYVLRVSGVCLPLLCLPNTYEPGTSCHIPASLIANFFFKSYLKVLLLWEVFYFHSVMVMSTVHQIFNFSHMPCTGWDGIFRPFVFEARWLVLANGSWAGVTCVHSGLEHLLAMWDSLAW